MRTAVSEDSDRLCFVDLFCGAGGFGAGLSQAGAIPVMAMDVDAKAVKAYNRLVGDIAIVQNVNDLGPNSLPSFDLLVAGPPCQPWSGQERLGWKDARNGFPALLRVIAWTKPSFLLIENVPGLYRSGDFGRIVKPLTEWGYRATWAVLNAADYGVPQSRLRLFIGGRRDGRDWPWPALTHTPQAGLFTHQWQGWDQALTLLLQSRPPDGPLPNWIQKRIDRQLLDTGRLMFHPQLGARFGTTEQRQVCYRRAALPSFTITTSGIGRGYHVVLDGDADRAYRLTATETALLQTLPTDTELTPVQVGNAVPPLLAQALGRALLSAVGAFPAQSMPNEKGEINR